eukprot:6790700-Prymnesium_polylepis.1
MHEHARYTRHATTCPLVPARPSMTRTALWPTDGRAPPRLRLQSRHRWSTSTASTASFCRHAVH